METQSKVEVSGATVDELVPSNRRPPPRLGRKAIRDFLKKAGLLGRRRATNGARAKPKGWKNKRKSRNQMQEASRKLNRA